MPKIKPSKKTPKTPNDDEDAEGQEGSEGEDDNEDTAEEENRRINAIVTSRVKREMKGVLSTLATIQESIKSLATAPKQTEESEDDGEDETPAEGAAKQAKGAEMDPKTSRKFTKLERELAEEREARKKAERERSEEQERAKRTEMRDLFKQGLAEHGVSDPKLQRAALTLLEEDGYMIRDEDGKPKFKGVDKYGIETLYDPKAGLKTWVATEGKSFVPAVEAGGSGAGGSRQNGNTANLSKGEFGKLSDAAKAAIELERASNGLPPLE